MDGYGQGGAWWAWERRRASCGHGDTHGDSELGEVGDDDVFAERPLDFLFHLQLGPSLLLFLLFISSSILWILFGVLKQFRKIHKYL